MTTRRMAAVSIALTFGVVLAVSLAAQATQEIARIARFAELRLDRCQR